VAAALPLVLILALLLLGVLQARANTEEPAVLRYQVWQLLAGGLVLLVLLTHTLMGTPLPKVDPKIGALVVALGLALVLLLRRRRADSGGGLDF
jgi:MYXO-CTERM domain-containing protein